MPIFGCSKCSTLMAGPEHTDKAVCGKCQMKAAVQQKFDEMERQIEALELQRKALFDLISESYGVAGLHLNGDVEPWEGLLEGGRFEEWLGTFGPPPTASEGDGDE